MTATDETIEQIRERAALYALGALSPAEARDVATRLAAGDACYESELAAFRSVADGLAYAACPQEPGAAVRARVLQRVATDQATVIEQPGLRFVRHQHGGWQPGVLPGIELKVLLADDTRGRATLLVRMAAGAVYPNHRHRDVEEIYLLEGDMLVNGVLMRAGDYCSAAAETVHDGIRSLKACLFIVSASTSDELII